MVWSDWVEGTDGEIAVQFRSNATCEAAACDSDAGVPVGCTCPVAARRRGVAIQNYEYRRFEPGASPFWTPLRRVGQYYDTETDLFEEGQRTYDPSVGRFFQPDPRVLNPEFIVWSAVQGLSAAPYVATHNNPMQASRSAANFHQVRLQATPPWNVHPAPGASFGMDPQHGVELKRAVEQGGSQREAASP
nr:RHS repeat-associated core domain-containing protein [Myxococcus sp. AM009]